ncbi:hypothetical protein [Ktedonospora formicarum]|uniref:Uncharacterized protein n=1 Tax=Ktedonospora formicarum TaxID=2778364 RepID=A0A8J3I775_9CHLR|nr:hypothetical protein [Ktedonospora formicarum]GHO48706.1 hypothetical protein KSX_68690 [Ktedonospora formicarum]
METRREQVRLRLPLSAQAIRSAIEAFEGQFHERCHVYICGHVTIDTGELCEIARWARVGDPGDELDLLGLGAWEDEDEDEDTVLAWVWVLYYFCYHLVAFFLSTLRRKRATWCLLIQERTYMYHDGIDHWHVVSLRNA